MPDGEMRRRQPARRSTVPLNADAPERKGETLCRRDAVVDTSENRHPTRGVSAIEKTPMRFTGPDRGRSQGPPPGKSAIQASARFRACFPCMGYPLFCCVQ